MAHQCNELRVKLIGDPRDRVCRVAFSLAEVVRGKVGRLQWSNTIWPHVSAVSKTRHPPGEARRAADHLRDIANSLGPLWLVSYKHLYGVLSGYDEAKNLIQRIA